MCIYIFRVLFTWGSNSFGQLGYGEFDTNEPLPKLSKKLATKTIVQISCGDHHNLVLTNGKSWLLVNAFEFILNNLVFMQLFSL